MTHAGAAGNNTAQVIGRRHPCAERGTSGLGGSILCRAGGAAANGCARGAGRRDQEAALPPARPGGLLTSHGHPTAEVVGAARVPHVFRGGCVVGARGWRGGRARVSAAETDPLGRAVGQELSLPSPGQGPILPEEGVFQVQEVTGFGARLVDLGHNTDVIALSAEWAGEGGREPAVDCPLPPPTLGTAPTFCWQSADMSLRACPQPWQTVVTGTDTGPGTSGSGAPLGPWRAIQSFCQAETGIHLTGLEPAPCPLELFPGMCRPPQMDALELRWSEACMHCTHTESTAIGHPHPAPRPAPICVVGELSQPFGRDSQTWRGPVLPSQPLACHLSQAWGHNGREVPGAGTACHAALTWSR